MVDSALIWGGRDRGKPGSSLTEGSGLWIQKHGLRQRVSFRGPENSLQIHWNEARQPGGFWETLQTWISFGSTEFSACRWGVCAELSMTPEDERPMEVALEARAAVTRPVSGSRISEAISTVSLLSWWIVLSPSGRWGVG